MSYTPITDARDYLTVVLFASACSSSARGITPSLRTPFEKYSVGVELMCSLSPSVSSCAVGSPWHAPLSGGTRFNIQSDHADARSFEHQIFTAFARAPGCTP